jgi:hypothetical protein
MRETVRPTALEVLKIIIHIMLHICCVSYPWCEGSLRTAATDGFIIHPPRDYEYGVLVE